MPVGVMIDCLCIVAGGLVGAKIKDKVPSRIIQPLNIVFGICAIAIGMVSLIKLSSLPAVILSLILGTLIGELLRCDDKIKGIFGKVISRMHFQVEGDRREYMNFYVTVAAVFCASGTNIFGAFSEGMTGDFTVLLSKASMDIFASLIFAAVLGAAMLIIVIPQFLILAACFYASRFVMPLISEPMLADFIAVGGLMTLALGFAIAKIKDIRAVNMLPALILVFPVSYLFHLFLE